MSSVQAVRPIVHTPGVVGGSARIGGTRIPVWQVVLMQREGMTATEIAAAYDQSELGRADIEAALAYANAHEREIERDIVEQDDESPV